MTGSESREVSKGIKSAWGRLKYIITGDSKHLFISSQSKEHPKPKVTIIPSEPPKATLRVSRVRITEEQAKTGERSYINPIENHRAADLFIRAIRNPSRYKPWGETTDMYSEELGDLMMDRDGFFYPTIVLGAAMERYNLPLAFYVSNDKHARLVLACPSPDSARGIIRITVYDPMIGRMTEVEHPQTMPLNARLFPNPLAEGELRSGRYDLTFSNDLTFNRYRDSFLLDGKFAPLQRDLKNCVAYCLFVGAMLQALKPGHTGFKDKGIDQFRKDFGVRIKPREEITKVKVSD